MGQCSSITKASGQSSSNHVVTCHCENLPGHKEYADKLNNVLDELFGASDGFMVDPTSLHSFRTDVRSLLDVDGDGIEFGEVMHAMFMTNKVGIESTHCGTLKGNDDHIKIDRAELEKEAHTAWEKVWRDHRSNIAATTLKSTDSANPIIVPVGFSTLKLDWTKPSFDNDVQSINKLDNLGLVMKQFVLSMFAGISVALLFEEGEQSSCDNQAIEVCALLTNDLLHLIISGRVETLSVPLRSVRHVQEGKNAKAVVMRLAGGRFAHFGFAEERQAAYFGTCMRLLVKGARSL